MTMNLSEAAKTALINAEHAGQGAKVAEGAFDELYAEGFVGGLGGLTRKGTIAREKLVNAKLEEMFG